MPTMAETISTNAGNSSKRRMLRVYPRLGTRIPNFERRTELEHELRSENPEG
jgi:hypothetical protein